MNERVMPSSHSFTVTALAMAVGFSEGFGSSYFATVVILAVVVMYDAFGVRLHAGRQAEFWLLSFAPAAIVSFGMRAQLASLFFGIQTNSFAPSKLSSSQTACT